MRRLPAFLVVLAVVVAGGCAATSGPRPTGSAAPAGGGDAPAPAPAPASGLGGAVLLIDRNDLRLGTTVQFDRVPTNQELYDLVFATGVARLLLVLDHWPDYEALQSLDRAPEGIEIVAVLQGYPPSRGASGAWDLLHVRPRLVVVVDGPPGSLGLIDDLNELRGLDRVIARMAQPSRDGFERLQRPLSFWKVVR